MWYLLFLCNVHTITQFTADMPPAMKTHVKRHARTQLPSTQSESTKNRESDPNAEEELGTKRATWDNDRDGLLIELLLVGLQQGKRVIQDLK